MGPKNYKQKRKEHPRFQVSSYPGTGPALSGVPNDRVLHKSNAADH